MKPSHSNQPPQQVMVAATALQIWGLCDQKHILKHNDKVAKYPLDAGVDLFPFKIGEIREYLGWREVFVHTGVHMMFAPGSFGFITDRSSTAQVTNGGTILPGIIDATYTGEIIVRVKIINGISTHQVHPVITAIEKCCVDRIAIAQVIAVMHLVPRLVIVDGTKLENHGRGSNGFGSTNNTPKT